LWSERGRMGWLWEECARNGLMSTFGSPRAIIGGDRIMGKRGWHWGVGE
jgi:hypothetical protein